MIRNESTKTKRRKSNKETHRGKDINDRWLLTYAIAITSIIGFIHRNVLISTVDAGKLKVSLHPL